MLRGFCTLTFYADDMTAAEAWYSEVFGGAPYFRRDGNGTPAYLEWRVGDMEAEFGLLSSTFRAAGDTAEQGGAILYWAVDDVDAAVDRLVSLGARPHQPATERGPGFVTATVVDPFGNILGVMLNAHYIEQIERLEQPSTGIRG